MGDGLAAVRAGVDDEAVAVTQLLCDGNLSRGCDQTAEHGGVLLEGFFGRGQVLFWNNEKVLRRLWVDVGKGEDNVIFVDAVDGDGAGGNLAEEAVERDFRWHG